MRQRGFYTLGFLLVLLAAIAGAYLARTLVGPVKAPDLNFITTIEAAANTLNLGSLLPSFGPAPPASVAPPLQPAEQEAGAPTSESAEQPEQPPTVSPTLPPTTIPDQALPAERATSTPAPATPAPTIAVVPAFAFLPLGDLRHGNEDCPGPSIRGAVRDASGVPLAGVRIWRYDQWGNEQTVESKSGEADLGQYDFPLGDSANVHYVQVVNASGAPVSPRVEVQHRQGQAADAACHWLDWVQR